MDKEWIKVVNADKKWMAAIKKYQTETKTEEKNKLYKDLDKAHKKWETLNDNYWS